jgi:hypothetical protein
MRSSLILALLCLALAVNAQKIKVSEVKINDKNIEKLIVEKIDASSVGEKMVTYRLFLDLRDSVAYQLITGSSETSIMYFETTGQWYNTPNAGQTFGENLISVLIEKNIIPEIQFDTFISSGALTEDRIGVPFSENEKGYISGSPALTVMFPDTEFTLFKNQISTGSYSTSNGSFAFNPIAVNSRGVFGATESNCVLIGQFTTDGVFSFNINAQTYNYKTNEVHTTKNISYTSAGFFKRRKNT